MDDVDPSPKFQVHAVGLFDDVSVNCTVNGAAPLSGVAVNSDTGTAGEGGFETTIELVFTPQLRQ